MENTSSTLSSNPGADRAAAALLAARILEDAELIGKLLALVPAGHDDWAPPGTGMFPVGHLVAHIVESISGVCACLYKLHPERLAHFEALAARTANLSRMSPAAAAALLADCRLAAGEGFALVADADLPRRLPTVFSPAGQPFAAVLLVNWKHLLHHGYQLFFYLKLLGVPVGTRHLYRF